MSKSGENVAPRSLIPARPRRHLRLPCTGLIQRKQAREAVDTLAIFEGAIMNINLSRAVRITAFVLATLGATSALVAAGLNQPASAASATQAG